VTSVFVLWGDDEIEAVFADRADADATAERTRGHVEEVAVLPPGSGDVIRPRLSCVAETYVYADNGPPGRISEHRSFVDKDTSPLPARVMLSGQGYLHVWAVADDMDTALRRMHEVAEQVAALIREGLAPKDIADRWRKT
jgi:hypothetical protein